MDLKDCIVVVNEFAVKNESSSDNRVRSYIMEYMTDGSVAFDVAFDNNKVVLDRDDLNKNANEIQKLFDNGSPVSTMTISFDDSYLKDNGLSRDDLDESDQLTLCHAVQHGIKRMNRVGYSDLRYVGSIHADTVSVYCRVVMVNAGDGKLSQEMQHDLRCGINDYLD